MKTLVVCILAASPLHAEVSCENVAETLELCLEQNDFMLLPTEFEGVFFVPDQIGGHNTIFEVSEDGFATEARYAEGVGALGNAQPLEDRSVGNLQIISWEMTSTIQESYTTISPAIITWVGTEEDGVVVETIFPNVFLNPEKETLSDAQRQSHFAIVAGIQEESE